MDSHITENQNFVINASPPAWKDYADELHHSASILWEAEDRVLLLSADVFGNLVKKSAISRTYILLTALSIENLANAIIVAQQPSFIENG